MSIVRSALRGASPSDMNSRDYLKGGEMRAIFFLSFLTTMAWADAPADLGKYTGVVVTGAILTAPLTFEGGSLYSCEINRRDEQEIQTCKVKDAMLTVEGKPLVGEFTKAVVLRTKSGLTYYYRGMRSVAVDKFKFDQTVSMTITVEGPDKNKIMGFVDVLSLDSRSAFEAYLVK